jgi:hypothetical protein
VVLTCPCLGRWCLFAGNTFAITYWNTPLKFDESGVHGNEGVEMAMMYSVRNDVKEEQIDASTQMQKGH